MTADLVTAPGLAVAPPEAPRRPRPGPRPPAELPEIVEETLRKTVSVKLSAETIDRLREVHIAPGIKNRMSWKSPLSAFWMQRVIEQSRIATSWLCVRESLGSTSRIETR